MAEEEEWWVKFWKESHRLYDVKLVEDVLGLIVAEAKRRGAEEAWRSAKNKYGEHLEMTSALFGRSVESEGFSRLIDAKIESLKKPVTDK